MHKQRRLLCILVCFASSVVPVSANTFFGSGQSFGWLREILQFSFLGFFSPIVPSVPLTVTQPPSSAPALALASGPCSVKPIPAINDEEAAAFEAANGSSGTVDLKGLTPATAIALSRFEKRVASLGGSVSVTSAYRPPAYQAHLQVVWDRHRQLANNYETGCAVLRAQVNDEFARHSLLETQRPVNRSDHTRGIGFDASLTPGLSIDRLARAAGVFRPDMFHDPVHFRLSALRPAPPSKRLAHRRVLRAAR